jgi:F-type H+-transporting ATPase subunit alpha
LEAFAKFGSDLDAATKSVLDKGSRNVEMLKQAQFSPQAVERQIAMIYLGTKNLLRTVPVNKVRDFEVAFIEYLNVKHRDTLDTLRAGKIDDSVTSVLETVGAEIAKNYSA